MSGSEGTDGTDATQREGPPREPGSSDGSTVESLREALAQAEGAGDAEAVAKVGAQLASALLGQGLLDDASAAARRGLEAAVQADHDALRSAALQLLAVIDLRRGDLDAATFWARQSLLLADHMGDRRAQAEAHDRLAEISLGRANLDAAQAGHDGLDSNRSVEMYDEASKLVSRHGNPVAWALLRLGLGQIHCLRARAGAVDDDDKAIRCLEDALTVLSSDARPQEHGTTLLLLGECYLRRTGGERARNLERAITSFEQAERTNALDPAQAAPARSLLARAYLDRLEGDSARNRERAIELLNLQVTLAQTSRDPRDLDEARLDLGAAYLAAGLEGDQGALERALELFASVVTNSNREENVRLWGTARTHQGTAWFARWGADRPRDVERAIEAFEEVRREASGRADLADLWASATSGLGNAYRERGLGDRVQNREQAVECFSTLVSALDRQRAPFDWALANMNLGVAFRERLLGKRGANLSAAIRMHRIALEVFNPESRPLEWARTSVNLAVALNDVAVADPQADLRQALRHLENALSVFTRERSPFSWAMAKVNQAASHRLLGAPAEAVACLTAAAEVLTPTTAWQEWAKLTFQRAELLAQQGDNDGALAMLKTIRGEVSLESAPRLCFTVSKYEGDLHARRGDWPRAVSAFRFALAASEELDREAILQSSKQVERGDDVGVHRNAAYAMARAGALVEAVIALERGRARRLGEALERDRIDATKASSEDLAAIGLYATKVAELRALEVEDLMRDWAQSGGTLRHATSDLRERGREVRAGVRSALERVRRVPGNERLLEAPGEEEIAAAASERPIAYILTTGAGSLILLCRGGESDAARLTVEPLWCDRFGGEEIVALLFGEGDDQTGLLYGQRSPALMDAALARALPMLGERLVGPLAGRLRELGARGAVLVPIGHLGLFPLHAARYELQGREITFLDEVEVSYAPSARVLGRAREAAERVTNGEGGLVVVANPLPHPAPLAFADVEVAALRDLLRPARVLAGREATQTALLEAVPSARYLHLACHAVFDLERPRNSYLHLADGDRLELAEIVAGTLFARTRLVTLSACQTALFDLLRLVDEYVGFPAACLEGGAPCVLSSLWPSNDIPTALVMARFYQLHLVGDPKSTGGPLAPAAALRLAQLWLANVQAGALLAELDAPQSALARGIAGTTLLAKLRVVLRLQDPQRRPFTQPRAWAPFVLVGV